MEKKEFKSMIPIETPDLDQLFGSKRQADKARVILQLMFYTRLRMKSNRNFAPAIDRATGWVPISSETARKMIRDYDDIVDILVSYHIIEFKKNKKGGKSFLPGEFSALYRVVFSSHITHPDQQRYRVETISYQGSVKALKRYYTTTYKSRRNEFLKDNKWYAPCLAFIDQLELRVPAVDYDRILTTSPHLIGAVEQFNDGLNKFVVRDDFGERIHTHFSNLPGILRKYLAIQDSESDLILLDVSSAQPFLLGALFTNLNILYDCLPEFSEIAGIIKKYVGSVSIKLFFEDVASGNFYNRLIDLIGLEKEKVKDQLFHHILYCPSSNFLTNPIEMKERQSFRMIFKMVYPDVFKLIQELKKIKKGELPFVYNLSMKLGKKGRLHGRMYIVPSVIAQRLEARIFLDMVVKKCCFDGIQVATIHDAFLIRRSDLVKFNQIFYGVFANLKIKPPVLKESHD